MLLQTRTREVADALAEQIVALQSGSGADEVRWKEIAVHACKILNASGTYLFVTAEQMSFNASAIDHARDDGITVVTVPDNIHAEIAGSTDVSGARIRDITTYQDEWNDSFAFDFVEPGMLSATERVMFERAPQIAQLIGGLPAHVAGIRVSRTMRADFVTGADALGLWDSATNSIVIRHDQLGRLDSFAGTLLHEIVHARTGYDDVNREFECGLTDALGSAAAAAISGSLETAPGRRPIFWPFG